jgi:ABC-type multidrug transport system ATPase subunit
VTGLPLVVGQLAFWYPGRPLWAGWSYRFAPGLTWVRGANGSGKSTLLRLLAGALAPATGSLTVGAAEAAAQPEAYRRQVFWCGPDRVAFDHLRPAEYFGFLAGLYPTLDLAAIPALVQALGLAPFMDRQLDQLSTGSGRKVAVVAALCAHTPVVLLDEPLAALDARSAAEVRAHLAKAAQARRQTWIVTSHEALGEAAEHATVLDLPPPPDDPA